MILVGDCLEQMAKMPDNSVDSIVTDPPYGLEFMGKEWDKGVPPIDCWQEALRILKPGGHLLSFGGSRTYHRMACAIEDAGFEIRDQIMWVYGSGFPKSLNVGKAIDRQRDDRNQILEVTAWIRAERDAAGVSNSDLDAPFGFVGMAGHWVSSKSQPTVPTLDQVPTLLGVLGLTLDDVPKNIRQLLWDLNGRKGQPGDNWAKREVVGKGTSGLTKGTIANFAGSEVEFDITAPATPEAKQWEGWGTALKPAHEPIVVARKPFDGTVANNVLAHGTGALNIEGCRVEANDGYEKQWDKAEMFSNIGATGNSYISNGTQHTFDPRGNKPVGGRWPANFIHDGSDEVLELFPNAKGGTWNTTKGARHFNNDGNPTEYKTSKQDISSGSAARFFYCAKANKKERNAGLEGFQEKQIGAKGNGLARTCGTCGTSVLDGCDCPDRTFNNPARQNHHPTVKPVALMRYLVRLVTPPNGIVFDPFLGSGTTAVAAILEGFEWSGCEITPEYLPIIEGRVAWAESERDAG